MKQIPIAAKRDFLERLASAPPVKAVSELIWNGLDAGATEVSVDIELNKLDSPERILVVDDGQGIDPSNVDALFGNLGASWKKGQNRKNGRSLHGKSGQGRFKAFALGNRVEWKTAYKNGGDAVLQYSVQGRADLLEKMSSTDPVESETATPGTVVVVSDIRKNHPTLLKEDAHREFAKIFAPYLSQYPDVQIIFNGTLIDPSQHQGNESDISLNSIPLPSGKTVSAVVTVIEWTMPTKREVHLCDADGISLHETEAGVQIRAPGFHFTVYIKCDYFKELDKDNLLMLDELHPDVDELVKTAKKVVSKHFRERLAQQQSHIVERWKREDIYPFEEKDVVDPVEEAERQVFDILAVNIESYLPSFEESDYKSRKFVFRLLAQAVRDNPESVQKIITGFLDLKKEEQEELAELMASTSLSSIISSAKIVANRLNFLVALEDLLFDKETKKKLLERDQLHKILEKESWLFDEEFALSGSEKRLEEVLQLHLGQLGEREDTDIPVLREGGKQGRVDLMLSRVNQPRHDERDHLVVELKRPSQKITSEVLNQAESYAIAVAQDPRFNAQKTRWRFIVVSNDMDEHAERKCHQRDKAPGLVFDDAELNIQVWGYKWTEIIHNARSRLQFINQSLSYEANREAARSYLEKAHAKFIPDYEPENNMGESSSEQVEGTDRP